MGTPQSCREKSRIPIQKSCTIFWLITSPMLHNMAWELMSRGTHPVRLFLYNQKPLTVLDVAEGHHGGVFIQSGAASLYGRLPTYPEQQKQQVKLSGIRHGICGWVILFSAPDGRSHPTSSVGRATWVNCMGNGAFSQLWRFALGHSHNICSGQN